MHDRSECHFTRTSPKLFLFLSSTDALSWVLVPRRFWTVAKRDMRQPTCDLSLVSLVYRTFSFFATLQFDVSMCVSRAMARAGGISSLIIHKISSLSIWWPCCDILWLRKFPFLQYPFLLVPWRTEMLELAALTCIRYSYNVPVLSLHAFGGW